MKKYNGVATWDDFANYIDETDDMQTGDEFIGEMKSNGDFHVLFLNATDDLIFYDENSQLALDTIEKIEMIYAKPCVVNDSWDNIIFALDTIMDDDFKIVTQNYVLVLNDNDNHRYELMIYKRSDNVIEYLPNAFRINDLIDELNRMGALK